MQGSNKRQVFLLGLTLTLCIFFGGFFLNHNANLEFLYPLIVLLTISIPEKRTTFEFSVGLSFFILLDFLLPSSQSIADKNIMTAVLPILFTWGFSFAMGKYKDSQAKLFKSTQYLDALFQYANEGIIISSEGGEIIMANPTSCDQLGYAKEEMTGMKIEDLVPKRFAGKHPGHRKEYFKSPHSRPMGKGMNLSARRKDGSELPVEISLSSFQIGAETFVISFIIDISERRKQELEIVQANEELELRVEMRTKELAGANLSLALANSNLKAEMRERARIEEALRDSERLYSTIAHHFPDGIICVLDHKLEIVFIDGKELLDLGINNGSLLKRNWRAIGLCNVEKEAGMDSSLKKVFNWETSSAECEFQGRSYSMNAVPLPDNKGEIKEILLVIKNITRRKKAENEILQTLEKEKELNEMKSRFVSMASHEFRTPLSTILSSISLVEKYDKPEDREKKAKHVDRIKTSVKNLTEILNDFLSIEKLEAGKVEVHLEEITLTRVCEELAEEMQTLATRGITISYSHTGGPEETVSDKQLLRNILINLLNNAIKYSKDDGKIEFTSAIDGEVRLSVKDHGIGIPERDQKKLFDRFFRAGNTTAIQGTGLGLNIVRRYAQLLGGNISFASELDQGSTFTVTIPFIKTLEHEKNPAD